MNTLLELFPNIKQSIDHLSYLNKSLGNITLVGKINALEAAANLFEFTDRTSHHFNELEAELAQALLDENIKKVVSELKGKSQIAIDILIRNLFERTADVGFLATDDVIVDFLLNASVSVEAMRARLNEYASKYTVYNEIVIFDTQGNARVNMNSHNSVKHSSDAILEQALNSSSYIESFHHSDIFPNQKKTLIYAQRIQHKENNIGVLCLCFKFDDELNLIINNLCSKEMQLSIADENGVIATSKKSKKTVTLNYSENEYLISKNNLAVTSKANSYQGYSGIEDWYAYAVDIAQADYQSTKEVSKNQGSANKEHKNLLDDKLKAIINKADDLVEDLSDVIINGEIIASKQRVYVLLPILEGIRTISTSLLTSIKESVLNLEYLVESSLINDIKTASHLALDIMDRNLYERANDCRWWALTPLFQHELSKAEPDSEKLHKTLLYINELYTVYTNLYVYDRNGVVVAASHDASIVGKKINKSYIAKVMQNRDAQNYFVSNFEQTSFYDERPTYIYNASITHENRNVGGIGIVFDAEVEFKAMLEDSLPGETKGFSFFVDEKGVIIASTHPTLQPLETLAIDTSLLSEVKSHALYHYLEFEEKSCLVSIARSQGYREYKKKDNYKNNVFCVTFVALSL